MRRYEFEDEDEDGVEELYIGTYREIVSLYKNLKKKTSAIPLFADDPVLVENRMYGICVQPDGFYTVKNADTCLAVLVEEERR